MSRFGNDPQKQALAQFLATEGESALTFHHEAAPLIGHVVVDMLEEAGFAPDDIDAVGGCSTDAAMIGMCVLFAAASRGLDVDAFHFVDGTVVGPELNARRVVVVVDGLSTGDIEAAIAVCRQAGAEVSAAVRLVHSGGDSDSEVPELAVFTSADLNEVRSV